MKICELCKSAAKIYCESDEANLCWTCDYKVHSANFLVAKHSRSLLCHVCQFPTPWNGSGEKLGRTISVCDRCVDDREESHGGNDIDENSSSEDEIEEEEDEISSEDEDGDDDNQVVPLSDSSPPPAASSSSSEACYSRLDHGGRDICLKQLRENSLDLCSEDDALDSASSDKNNITPAAAGCARVAFVDSFSLRPLKRLRTESNPPPKVQHQSGQGRYNDRDSSVSS